MANHNKHITTLKNKLEYHEVCKGANLDRLLSDDLNKTYETQQAVLNMIIHTADVSNPGKPLKTYLTWVDLIFEEFFNQGNLEKSQNLPVSLLCDRESTNISKAQIGFITYIVKPTFYVIIELVPKAFSYMENIDSNLKYFQEIIKKEDENKNKSITE
jgi:cAMP-specific phosphodiesterase 4